METISTQFVAAMLLAIAVSVVGIFGPQYVEKRHSNLSVNNLSWLHCHIFGWSIFVGGVSLLFGLLGLVGTVATIASGELVLFGAMYFIGLLAHESDKARVSREEAAAQARRQFEHQRNAAERARRQAEQAREQEEAICISEQFNRLHSFFFNLYVDILVSVFENPHELFRLRHIELFKEFVVDVENGCFADENVIAWRLAVVTATQNPDRLRSKQCMYILHLLVDDYIERRLQGRKG